MKAQKRPQWRCSDVFLSTFELRALPDCPFLLIFNIGVCFRVFNFNLWIVILVSLCVRIYSSTVKDSSDCKMPKTYLRGTYQPSCVVNIYLGASAKLLDLPIFMSLTLT